MASSFLPSFSRDLALLYQIFSSQESISKALSKHLMASPYLPSSIKEQALLTQAFAILGSS